MPVLHLNATSANRQQRRAKTRTAPTKDPMRSPPPPGEASAIPMLPAAALTAEQAVMLDLYGQQPVAFHRMFVDITGSVTAALWLSHAIALMQQGPTDDAAITLSQDACQAATGLTRREQETARAKLRSNRLITEHRSRRQLQYRVDLRELSRQLLAHSVDSWAIDALPVSTGTAA